MLEKKEKSFLIIDDDQIDQLIASRTIIKEYPDLACLSFPDGEKAFEYLKGTISTSAFNNIQFIIVDLMMPIMDGFEFLEAYNESLYEIMPDLKVFVASSSINKQDKAVCLAYPFVKEFITKPFNKEVITLHEKN
jgi:CheY-like chemotaxis protein